MIVGACYADFLFRVSDCGTARTIMGHVAQFTQKKEASGDTNGLNSLKVDYFGFWRALESELGTSYFLSDVDRVERLVEIQHSNRRFNSEVVLG